MADDIQYVKSVSGTWHRYFAVVPSAHDEGGLKVQTDCDRVVKVARMSNTKPSGKGWCCECNWTRDSNGRIVA